MTDKVFAILYYAVYAVELFLFGEGIFHNRVRGKAKYAAAAGGYLLVLVPTVLLLNNNIFVIMALNISAYIVLFQGNIFSNVIHFGVVYLLTNMAESMIFGISAFLCTLVLNGNMPLKLSAPGAVGGISLLLAVVVTVFMLCIIKMKQTQKFIACFRALNRFHYLVIIVAAWSGILLIGSFTGKTGHEQLLFMIVLIFMTAAITGIGWLVWNEYSRAEYLKQNRVKEEIIKTQNMYYRNVYENDREMRKFRHDIRSQLGCLELLLAEGKTEQAMSHLQTIGAHFGELDIPKCHTGSELLDVIVSQKIQEADKKGIRIILEGRLDGPEFMDTYDLCTLFSNMIGNGIEACEAVHGLQDTEKIITIAFLVHGNTVFFRFVNPAEPEMYEALKRGGTTKADGQNHGFGMENIRRVVYKNGGEMEYVFQDGKLTVEFYFEVTDAT